VSALTVLFAVAVLCALPSSAAAKTCSEYPNQAAAQRAADTRDGDGDGIYCESLPCPCSSATPGGTGGDGGGTHGTAPSSPRGCIKPSAVQNISFSKTKYPNIRAHFLRALRRGWPRTLLVNRKGAGERRDRLLADIPTKPGFDRDEYPPAVGRGAGPGLMRGLNPVGWIANVEYVPSAENRSHGSSLGTKLRRFCDGTRFRYVFY
jgi:hypothetical protein